MIVDRISPADAAPLSKLPTLAKKIFSETGLAVIEVSGRDAAKFLQGQVTCDINSLTATQATIAAFCNAKGRVISTLMIVSIDSGLLLILPAGLRDTVLKKLRIYVLRADVKLQASEHRMVYGLEADATLENETDWPNGDFQVTYLPQPMIKLPGASRYLVLSDNETWSAFCNSASEHTSKIGSLAEWRFQDMSTGLPWFDLSQSEQHIPQMLNIDHFGGISFSKGCYTGQEIVARSHYLGKIKRALFIAEMPAMPTPPVDGCPVLEHESLRNFGCVLASATWSGTTRLLLVLQIVDELPKQLILDDDYRSPVAVISDP